MITQLTGSRCLKLIVGCNRCSYIVNNVVNNVYIDYDKISITFAIARPHTKLHCTQSVILVQQLHASVSLKPSGIESKRRVKLNSFTAR